ncbi:hypothetical protein VCHC17A2_3375B, partial [Vibrio cholerae HC-17A2]
PDVIIEPLCGSMFIGLSYTQTTWSCR